MAIPILIKSGITSIVWSEFARSTTSKFVYHKKDGMFEYTYRLFVYKFDTVNRLERQRSHILNGQKWRINCIWWVKSASLKCAYFYEDSSGRSRLDMNKAFDYI